jgi:hypothetical protein
MRAGAATGQEVAGQGSILCAGQVGNLSYRSWLAAAGSRMRPVAAKGLVPLRNGYGGEGWRRVKSFR